MRTGQIIGFMLWQGSSQAVQLHTWGFFALFPSSPNPSSPEALGSAPVLSWVQHPVCHSKAALPAELGAEKPSRGLKRVLVPLWFSLGTLLPKPTGLQCVRREDGGGDWKDVTSYSLKWKKPYRKMCVLCSMVALTSWKAPCS